MDLYDKDLTKAIINERGKIEEEYLTTDIRKYRMGDNLKKIHWKISAKHGELYVKNEDTVSGGRVIIFLNMNKEDYSLQYHNEVEEKLISLCVSLVNTMRINGTKVNINISNYEQKSFYIRTKKDFYELMEYFITHKSQGKSNFPNLIIDKISDYKNIVVITPKISKELKEKLIFLSIMKHKVEVFYYSNHSENFDNIISLKQFYIKCVDIRKIYS
ncbi:DUF58 domain-containing protein [Clostridium tetanomorphum]|uniref:DUF58 domain-containing protein n=1 Tax=Clostridium tetanomorphum TaxID=1553 RepID=UPI00311A8A37